MTVTEKYINPFTDFGFKKLFGTEPNKDLPIDFLNEVILPKQRLYVLKNLHNLHKRPTKLQEKIFQRLFETAEIARFTPEEKQQYEDSLKSYRDLKNVIDTSYGDGKKDGENEEKVKGLIKALKQGKLTIEDIAEVFSTSIDFVLQIKKEQNL